MLASVGEYTGQFEGIASGDWATALIGLSSLAVLFRWKIPNPALIAATAAIGLAAFPLLQPGWVMIK